MNGFKRKLASAYAATLLVVAASFSAGWAPLAQAANAMDLPTFDHAQTGFILRDVHTTLRCEQCHVDSIFKNTPRDCAGCHSIGSRIGATPKPVNHVPTAAPCETCHESPTSFLVKSYKHQGVTGRCASCHNQQSGGVTSKPATHFPTLQPCETCHTNTNTFQSWRMDHTQYASGGCATCHGGQYPKVTSKSAMHIATTAPCEACHKNTNTFLGATYGHDPAAVAGRCSTCHNGQTATGKSAAHIATAAQCDTCHTQGNTNGYTTFLGARYNHASVAAGSCATCHNGATAKGKTPTHIPTTAACDACHTPANTFNYQSFLGAYYNHATPSPAGLCSTCHSGAYTGALGKPAMHVSTTAQCDTCHTKVLSQNYTTFLGATYNHSAVAPGTCATCHNGVKATGKNAIHITTTLSCDFCHTQANTNNYTTFLGVATPHNPTFNATIVPGSCANALCHDGTTAVGKPALHISTTAACDTCHTAANTGNYTTFLGAVFAHATATPAVAGTCSTCHSGVFPGALGKPKTHIATTAQCDSCHVNTANYTTWLGATNPHLTASFNTNPPVAGICSTCHNGLTALGKPVSHMATTAQCDTCHTVTNTANYTTFLGAGVAHTTAMAGTCAKAGCHDGAGAKGLSTGHIPTGGVSCDSGGCHKMYGAGVTSFFPAAMNHVVTAAMRCDTCHNGAYTTQGVAGGAKAKVANHIPTAITGTLDCNTCHTTLVAATVASMSWLTEKMNHNGAMGGAPNYCVTCHLTGVSYLGQMQKKNHQGASVAKDCSSASCHKPLGRTGTAYIRWK